MEERNYLKEIRAAVAEKRGGKYSQAAMAKEIGLSIQSLKRLEGNGGLPTNSAVLRNLKALGVLVNIEVPE